VRHDEQARGLYLAANGTSPGGYRELFPWQEQFSEGLLPVRGALSLDGPAFALRFASRQSAQGSNPGQAN